MSLINNEVSTDNIIKNKMDEEIIVVKRDILFEGLTPWNGFLPHDQSGRLFKNICSHYEYYHRGSAEKDDTYKQIIPYIVFIHEDKIFLMNRGAKGNEKRLAHKYSIGIGGHLHREDVTSNDPLLWGIREFTEEVTYAGNYHIKLIGFVNDDSTDVGKVHLGMCMALYGDSKDISITDDELIWGELLSMEHIAQEYSQKLESWSNHVLSYLMRSKMCFEKNI